MNMQNKTQKLLVFGILLLIFTATSYYRNTQTEKFSPSEHSDLSMLFEQKRSNVQVTGSGIIAKILPDDLKGSRHQKFIVKVSGNHTILIAHNIDIASRIPKLRKGEPVEFYGEYEFNDRGGVVHWTHHDPGGKHADGWISYDGQIYQ